MQGMVRASTHPTPNANYVLWVVYQICRAAVFGVILRSRKQQMPMKANLPRADVLVNFGIFAPGPLTRVGLRFSIWGFHRNGLS